MAEAANRVIGDQHLGDASSGRFRSRAFRKHLRDESSIPGSVQRQSFILYRVSIGDIQRRGMNPQQSPF